MTPAQRREHIEASIGRRVEDFVPADLHAIASGPIMDPGRLYLPAGRLTEAEAQARTTRILQGPSE